MAVGGLILGAVGMGLQLYGQSQQTKALQASTQAREQQMELDAMRQRREIARNAQMARSTALANATDQGAAYGSGLQGGYGQIAGQAGTEMQGVNQNTELGERQFAANASYYKASVFTDIGSGLYSLGGSLMNNAGVLQRVGQTGFF